MLLDKKGVMDFLPHRDPFLFIDSIESVEANNCELDSHGLVLNNKMAGIEIQAFYKTCADHPIFKGHFPGHPIFPGVCQVEMMAQATTFVLFKVDQDPYSLNLDIALLGVDKSRFRQPILPEMDLKISCKISRSRGLVLTSECKVFFEDKLVSEAQIMASLKATR